MRTKGLWLGGAALCLLLALTAVLQYRWINRVSVADQQLRRNLLEATLRNLQGDVDRQLRDTQQYFRRALGVAPGTAWETRLNATLTQWQREAERPRLLRAVSFATLPATGAPVLKRRAANATEFTPQAWPAALTPYRRMLEQRLRTAGGDLPLAPNDLAQEFSDGQPLLVFQLVEDPKHQAEFARLGRPAEQRNAEELLNSLTPASAQPPPGRAELAGWCWLELDAAYIQTQWLPELLERYFSQRGMEGYQLALLTGQPPRALYQSNARLAVASFASADAALVLFTRRIQPAAGRPGERRPPADRPPADRPPDDRPPDARPDRPPDDRPPPPPRERRRPPQEFTAFDAAADPTAWRLVVKDAAGSVETAIAQARHRNLALAFGVLLILAASFALMIVATQRARRLAAQQLEFVAGVSHELRTPLAVIQSTSHNLAQGLVKDPGRVQQYGAAIQTEVRRLSNQVEQMLAFAGIQAGRRPYDLRPVKLAELCERALAEYSFAADGWQVECDLPVDLPPVLADAQALESVVKNLLHNAQKYAAEGRWLSVRATAQQHEVQLTIADHGPGIAAADLPHLFEPFYRGQRVVATTIPGAGLGLSLVQRHLQAMGGRVTVKTTTAKESESTGTTFILHLPVT